jgi:hypothetical protein
MSAGNPLRRLPVRIVADASADSTEFFTHYDAFGYWMCAFVRDSSPDRAGS